MRIGSVDKMLGGLLLLTTVWRLGLQELYNFNWKLDQRIHDAAIVLSVLPGAVLETMRVLPEEINTMLGVSGYSQRRQMVEAVTLSYVHAGLGVLQRLSMRYHSTMQRAAMPSPVLGGFVSLKNACCAIWQSGNAVTMHAHSAIDSPGAHSARSGAASDRPYIGALLSEADLPCLDL